MDAIIFHSPFNPLLFILFSLLWVHVQYHGVHEFSPQSCVHSPVDGIHVVVKSRNFLWIRRRHNFYWFSASSLSSSRRLVVSSSSSSKALASPASSSSSRSLADRWLSMKTLRKSSLI